MVTLIEIVNVKYAEENLPLLVQLLDKVLFKVVDAFIH